MAKRLLGWNKTVKNVTRGYFLKPPSHIDPWVEITKVNMGYGGFYFTVDFGSEYLGQRGTLFLAKHLAEQHAADLLRKAVHGNPKKNPAWTPALYSAAQKFLQEEGGKAYAAQVRAHVKAGRARGTARYSVPEWHDDMVKALGFEDPSTFLALKHEYLVRNTPLAKAKKNPFKLTVRGPSGAVIKSSTWNDEMAAERMAWHEKQTYGSGYTTKVTKVRAKKKNPSASHMLDREEAVRTCLDGQHKRASTIYGQGGRIHFSVGIGRHVPPSLQEKERSKMEAAFARCGLGGMFTVYESSGYNYVRGVV